MMLIVINKRKVLYSFIIIISFLIIGQINILCIQSVINSAPVPKKVIVIDPGHGGRDPGAIGISGTLEKNINLQISQKLKKVLEDSGYMVIMIRDTDILLNDDGAKNRKASDMRNRIKIINDSNCNMVISIHLNSFSQSKYYGAQVFYPPNRENSKRIGEILQSELKEKVDNTNNRVAKPIDSILMFNSISVPCILVECGFLSNAREEELLKTDEHQQKIVNAINSGINKYYELEEQLQSN